jgi:hypothetical protein
VRAGESSEGVAEAYGAVAGAAEALGEALRADFPSGADVAFDSVNNQLLLRKLPAPTAGAGGGKTEYYNPRDRTGKVRNTCGGVWPEFAPPPCNQRPPSPAAAFTSPYNPTPKVMAGRWTTARVAAAQADYSASCAKAEAAVRVAVAALSARLADEMPTLCHAAHWCEEFTFIGAPRSHLCMPLLVSPLSSADSLVLNCYRPLCDPCEIFPPPCVFF